MKVIFEHLPTIEIGGQKLVGRVLFGLLVLFSAAVGAAAGLLLVYSTDLPQVDELERYRPSSVTELYDTQGRVIGTLRCSAASSQRMTTIPKSCATRSSRSKTRISTRTLESTSGVSSARPIATSNPAEKSREPPRSPCTSR